MQVRQKVVHAALRRAKAFFERYVTELGDLAGSPARQRLDEAMKVIAADDAANTGARQLAEGGTVTKHELRYQLREQHMGPISAIAQSEHLGIPVQKMARFVLPPATASDVVLIAAGRAMATAAAEFYDVFKAEKLRENFVPALRAAVDALERSIIVREGERLSRKRASLAIDVQIQKVRRVLRILTSFVLQRLFGRPELIGIWRQAVRIGPRVDTGDETGTDGSPEPVAITGGGVAPQGLLAAPK